MLPFIQFVHVLSAIVLLGLVIASFMYVSVGIKQENVKAMRLALSASFVLDRFIAAILIGLFLTGTWLVSLRHISFHTPWIIVAYHVVGLVSVLWLILFFIKRKNTAADSQQSFRYLKLFYVLNMLVIILLCLAVHDAVTQSTWFSPAHIERRNSDV